MAFNVFDQAIIIAFDIHCCRLLEGIQIGHKETVVNVLLKLISPCVRRGKFASAAIVPLGFHFAIVHSKNVFIALSGLPCLSC